MQPGTRNAVTALGATACGLVLLLNFKTPSTDATTDANGTTDSGPAGQSAQSGSGSQTITGPAEANRWGTVQVEITVENGEITDVSLAQQPSSHRRSVEINDYAVPILEQETLTAQSARIDMVSGATDTSVGYITSLQGALDASAGA